MAKTKLSAQQKKRVDFYRDNFKNESQIIRDAVVSYLPFYNEMLKMNALTFREFALMPLAIEEGYDIYDPLFSYDVITPYCPFCQSKDKVRIKNKKTYLYICDSCGKTFKANWKSLSSGTKCDALTWLKVLSCMMEFKSIDDAQEICGIARETYYYIRKRLLYAMKLFLDRNLKLYGNIQMDNKFISASYKGQLLSDKEYPEGSVFDEPDFIPREARKRGGGNSNKDRNVNSCHIFCAIDDRGHTIVKFTGLGTATAARLKNTLDLDKFLKTVPEEDPFPYKNKSKAAVQTKPGDLTMFISDKESALIKLAKDLEYPIESHVYRRNNKQVKLAQTAHNIQRVNNVHMRLKRFLSDSNYISSKYLPGYLVFFEFIENTSASPEAIKELFLILSEPGHGDLDDSFFDSLYTIPNYYLQLLDENNPLRKISYNRLNMYYLYAKRKDMLASGRSDEAYKVKDICEMCNCTGPQLRRNYKNLYSSGFDDLIRNFFETNVELNSKEQISLLKPSGSKTINQIKLAMYDDYSKNRQLIKDLRLTFKQFVDEENRKFGTHYSYDQLQYAFILIEIQGLRPPLPPLGGSVSKQELCLQEFNKQLLSYRSKGEKPDYKKIYTSISEKYHIDYDSAVGYVSKARAKEKNN